MQLLDQFSGIGAGRYFGPGRVLAVDDSDQRVQVQPTDHAADVIWARMVFQSDSVLPDIGDEVLVAGELADELFVIGRLTPPRRQRLTTASGLTAESDCDQHGLEFLRVLNSRQELLFEVDSRESRTRVAVPEGSLEIHTARGDLTLSAAGTVRVEGLAVEVQARQRLWLGLLQLTKSAAAWLRLTPGHTQLQSSQLDISTETARLSTVSTAVACTDASVTAQRCQLETGRLETSAGTVIQRAGNIYQSVTELLQTQAGRLRTLVSGFSHFRSRRAWFSSEETFQIDGEKINLG